MDDFSMILPTEVFDESGMFLEELLNEDWSTPGSTTPAQTLSSSYNSSSTAATNSTAVAQHNSKNNNSGSKDFDEDYADEDDDEEEKPKKPTAARTNARKLPASSSSNKTSSQLQQTTPSSTTASPVDDSMDDGNKAKKRREQIALASRASRARRKQELDDLRDENKRLREERAQFLGKIGELQEKVETMREKGSTDMRLENELLRAQLEEHKRFVSCFKQLCDGAPSSLNARHQIYREGSDSAQAHVLGLISQSQADEWLEATVPPEAQIPYSNFSMFYKYKKDFGSEGRLRLNVRVDVLFPGLDASLLAEFFWKSQSTTQMQERLYNVKGIELTQLADDMPDKDTKTVYYREQIGGDQKDRDWVMICNRKRKELACSTLALPRAKKTQSGKVAAMVVATCTTQHSSVSPVAEFESANRINSLYIQGSVSWNVGSDARLIVVFSMPDDLKIKAIEKLEDVVDQQTGMLAPKFAEVLKSFQEMIGESRDWS